MWGWQAVGGVNRFVYPSGAKISQLARPAFCGKILSENQRIMVQINFGPNSLLLASQDPHWGNDQIPFRCFYLDLSELSCSQTSSRGEAFGLSNYLTARVTRLILLFSIQRRKTVSNASFQIFNNQKAITTQLQITTYHTVIPSSISTFASSPLMGLFFLFCLLYME